MSEPSQGPSPDDDPTDGPESVPPPSEFKLSQEESSRLADYLTVQLKANGWTVRVVPTRYSASLYVRAKKWEYSISVRVSDHEQEPREDQEPLYTVWSKGAAWNWIKWVKHHYGARPKGMKRNLGS